MKPTVRIFAKIVFIAILLEVFVFNFKFWTTMNYEPRPVEITDVGIGLEEKAKNTFVSKNNENSYIEIRFIDEELKNIYLDFESSYKEKGGYRQLFKFFMTDEGNKEYYQLPMREVIPNVERSKYITFNTAGMSDKLLIRFEKDDNVSIDRGNINYTIKFNSIVINKPVPFFFNGIRLVTVLFICLFLYSIRYNTSLFNIKTNYKSNKQKIVLVTLILVNIIFLLFIYKNNLKYYHWDRNVYTNLAESILNGRFDLPMLDLSDELLKMNNPYDTRLRNSIVGTGNYSWDYAFYNGKYYVYFGVVPCLILFLPLKAFFNYNLPVNTAACIFTAIYIIIAFRFINTVIKKLFGNIPFLMQLMLSEMFVFCSALFPVLIKMDLYCIPNITALSFSLLGLDMWLNSVNKDGNIISNIKIFIGSLCLALAVGCRPQFAMASFLSVFIFKDVVIKKIKFDYIKGRDILSLIAFVLPYVVIGSMLMYYNYARFGSVTDFGAMYNLTTNDMTKRGFRLGRVPYGIFAYLFQIPELTTSFPYLNQCNNFTGYMGVTIIENMRGGIFIFNPLLWLNLFAFTKTVKEYLKEKKIFGAVVAMNIFALIILIADANMAGLVNRYMIDFTWLFTISAIMIYLTIYEKLKPEFIKPYRFILSVVFVFAITVNILLVFTTYFHYTLDVTNPDLFYSIKSAIEFWR